MANTQTAQATVQRKKLGIRHSTFAVKILNWEYWPMWLANLPVVIFMLWFALRARKLFFFSAVNPVIETGGMWGESKWGILQRIPKTHLPATVFIEKNTAAEVVSEKMKSVGLAFPVIAKPDVGERGTLVSKVKNEEELRAYLSENSIDFLLQEFLDLPVELAVMHHCFPGETKGKVTSICIKKMLSVTGDGRSNVAELMADDIRASLQLERFQKVFPKLLAQIPAAGEKRLLEPIGNHCRGTMFLNGNPEIDEQLTRQFDKVMAKMDGIHYGRFDLKCRSIDDLRRTGYFQVMEYNGVGAEAAHIYDPSYPFLEKYRDVYRHWRTIYQIYREQRKRGFRGMSFGEAWERFRVYRDYQQGLAK